MGGYCLYHACDACTNSNCSRKHAETYTKIEKINAHKIVMSKILKMIGEPTSMANDIMRYMKKIAALMNEKSVLIQRNSDMSDSMLQLISDFSTSDQQNNILLRLRKGDPSLLNHNEVEKEIQYLGERLIAVQNVFKLREGGVDMEEENVKLCMLCYDEANTVVTYASKVWDCKCEKFIVCADCSAECSSCPHCRTSHA